MFSNALYRIAIFCLLLVMLFAAERLSGPLEVVKAQTVATLQIEVGDTWQSLHWRFGEDVFALNPGINPRQEPAIGSSIVVPDSAENGGILRRILPQRTQTLHALADNVPLSQLFDPRSMTRAEPLQVTYAPILIANGSDTIRELPAGFGRFELSINRLFRVKG